MAPELLQKGKMTRAADVYSFAMIMVELFTCKRLFEGLAQQQVVSRACTAHCQKCAFASATLLLMLLPAFTALEEECCSHRSESGCSRSHFGCQY